MRIGRALYRPFIQHYVLGDNNNPVVLHDIITYNIINLSEASVVSLVPDGIELTYSARDDSSLPARQRDE